MKCIFSSDGKKKVTNLITGEKQEKLEKYLNLDKRKTMFHEGIQYWSLFDDEKYIFFEPNELELSDGDKKYISLNLLHRNKDWMVLKKLGGNICSDIFIRGNDNEIY